MFWLFRVSLEVRSCERFEVVILPSAKVTFLLKSRGGGRGRGFRTDSKISRACVPLNFKRYFCKADIEANTDVNILRPIQSCGKRKKLVSANKHIAYTTYRGAFKS